MNRTNRLPTDSLGRAAWAAIAALPLLMTLIIATPALATEQGGGEGNEGCPSPTAHLVTFAWDGSSFAPEGGDAMGVTVSGDGGHAFWTSSQVISALVISAGGVSYNIALDFPETAGNVSPHNYSPFGGSPMDSLGFCTGEKTRPDTTTSGPSVELSKTAECVSVEAGLVTVTGTITADLDSTRPARITTALDTILGAGNVPLHSESVTALVGQVLTADNDEITVPYTITFGAGGFQTFDNFIEVTLEDAETGEDRHKIYNARAAFELCGEVQPPTGSITIIKDASPDDGQDFAFTTTGEGLSAFTLDDDADPTLSNQQQFTELAPGTYTVAESTVSNWTLTSITCSAGDGDVPAATATIELTAGANVTCTFVNTRQGGQVTPGNPPREDTEGGNPLPDTAVVPTEVQPHVALLALLALSAVGTCGALAAVEVRRRR